MPRVPALHSPFVRASEGEVELWEKLRWHRRKLHIILLKHILCSTCLQTFVLLVIP